MLNIEKFYNKIDVIQPIEACMTCVIEFNIITTYMIVFKINTYIAQRHLFII